MSTFTEMQKCNLSSLPLINEQVTHVDEANIFLVNLHQLLIGLVLHGWLRVGSHGNQVWHTLKEKYFKSVISSSVIQDGKRMLSLGCQIHSLM